MDYAGADLQGAIGYMFDRALRHEFRRREPVAVVTQTLVDRQDPAFADPSKPIGSQMDEATARRLAAAQGWGPASRTPDAAGVASCPRRSPRQSSSSRSSEFLHVPATSLSPAVVAASQWSRMKMASYAGWKPLSTRTSPPVCSPATYVPTSCWSRRASPR